MVYSFHSIVKFALNLREIYKKKKLFCKFFMKSDFGKPRLTAKITFEKQLFLLKMNGK